jgi:hypothetical protein
MRENLAYRITIMLAGPHEVKQIPFGFPQPEEFEHTSRMTSGKSYSFLVKEPGGRGIIFSASFLLQNMLGAYSPIKLRPAHSGSTIPSAAERKEDPPDVAERIAPNLPTPPPQPPLLSTGRCIGRRCRRPYSRRSPSFGISPAGRN